ncbi:hypothetical protein FA13DRAFT_294935 [Coprinellus micaceus]|uniref:Secreted protein n=1 Tax=Coprinellus micaceus TaxID=71717 RepID=A0A4Y7SDV5_COPMI|nr:hypothetical protein FA13DRAFT_294935 [Coprinellus micaceus]
MAIDKRSNPRRMLVFIAWGLGPRLLAEPYPVCASVEPPSGRAPLTPVCLLERRILAASRLRRRVTEMVPRLGFYEGRSTVGSSLLLSSSLSHSRSEPDSPGELDGSPVRRSETIHRRHGRSPFCPPTFPFFLTDSTSHRSDQSAFWPL